MSEVGVVTDAQCALFLKVFRRPQLAGSGCSIKVITEARLVRKERVERAPCSHLAQLSTSLKGRREHRCSLVAAGQTPRGLVRVYV